VQENHLGVVKELLACGKRIELGRKAAFYHLTACQVAAQVGNGEMVALLREYERDWRLGGGRQ
jgi:hypothetical protein